MSEELLAKPMLVLREVSEEELGFDPSKPYLGRSSWDELVKDIFKGRVLFRLLGDWKESEAPGDVTCLGKHYKVMSRGVALFIDPWEHAIQCWHPATGFTNCGMTWGVNGIEGKMTVAKVEARARQLARADPAFMQGTLRQWARELGCSTGTVAKLSLWNRRPVKKAGRGSKSPKAIDFDPAQLADHTESPLERLIAEQQKDFEPSPLDPDPPDQPRRRVKCRKRP